MRYALLICTDESAEAAQSPAEGEARYAEYMKFGEEMGRRGVLTGGERLHPTTDATTVACATAKSSPPTVPSRRPRSRWAGSISSIARTSTRRSTSRRRSRARATARSRFARSGRCERRRRGRGRDGVPDRVGPDRRDVDPRHRRLGSRRGMRAGRLHARTRDVGPRRRPAQSRRVAHDRRPQPRA